MKKSFMNLKKLEKKLFFYYRKFSSMRALSHITVNCFLIKP